MLTYDQAHKMLERGEVNSIAQAQHESRITDLLEAARPPELVAIEKEKAKVSLQLGKLQEREAALREAVQAWDGMLNEWSEVRRLMARAAEQRRDIEAAIQINRNMIHDKIGFAEACDFRGDVLSQMVKSSYAILGQQALLVEFTKAETALQARLVDVENRLRAFAEKHSIQAKLPRELSNTNN